MQGRTNTECCVPIIEGKAGSLPVYPIKTLMAISFSFLLIQGFSNLIHNIRVLQGKAEGVR